MSMREEGIVFLFLGVLDMICASSCLKSHSTHLQYADALIVKYGRGAGSSATTATTRFGRRRNALALGIHVVLLAAGGDDDGHLFFWGGG